MKEIIIKIDFPNNYNVKVRLPKKFENRDLRKDQSYKTWKEGKKKEISRRITQLEALRWWECLKKDSKKYNLIKKRFFTQPEYEKNPKLIYLKLISEKKKKSSKVIVLHYNDLKKYKK